MPYWGEIQALITQEKDRLTADERAVRVVRAETTDEPHTRHVGVRFPPALLPRLAQHMKNVEAKKVAAAAAAQQMPSIAQVYARLSLPVPPTIVQAGLEHHPVGLLFQMQGKPVPPEYQPKPLPQRGPAVAPPPEAETPVQGSMLKKMTLLDP